MILPVHGPGAAVTVPDAARIAEELGFDSVWMSDHVVMVEGAVSPYPFDPEGVMRWDIDHPMLDALVGLAVAAAVTTRIGLGTSVLIAPMCNPVVLAKQAATLDLLSGGRVSLGVGVGWLAEEFAALGAPFEDRGARLDEWMAILRDCWTGRPAARRYKHWELPPVSAATRRRSGRSPSWRAGCRRPPSAAWHVTATAGWPSSTRTGSIPRRFVGGSGQSRKRQLWSGAHRLPGWPCRPPDRPSRWPNA